MQLDVIECATADMRKAASMTVAIRPTTLTQKCLSDEIPIKSFDEDCCIVWKVNHQQGFSISTFCCVFVSMWNVFAHQRTAKMSNTQIWCVSNIGPLFQIWNLLKMTFHVGQIFHWTLNLLSVAVVYSCCLLQWRGLDPHKEQKKKMKAINKRDKVMLVVNVNVYFNF